MTNPIYTGWDIGGAHLKVAQADSLGNLLSTHIFPCSLWLGIEQLDQALAKALEVLAPSLQHRITMTGELVDSFKHRRQGVTAIIEQLSMRLSSSSCWVFTSDYGWLSLIQAKQHWQSVASMNWLASAALLAQHFKKGLFIDIGSTTSDIIMINDHQCQPIGYNDFERQLSGELHYSGAIRTPLIALAQRVPYQNQWLRIAAELFATTADCWCLIGELEASRIEDKSSDGQPWDPHHCCQRLARLLGTDIEQQNREDWIKLAYWFGQQQVLQISESIDTVLTQHNEQSQQIPIIGAGVGRFIVKRCAENLSRPYLELNEVIPAIDNAAADHAPAVAMALLAGPKIS